jgi:hypothetical protein
MENVKTPYVIIFVLVVPEVLVVSDALAVPETFSGARDL